jgi:gamma-glutamylcyclotransferase (GGCT)/AIG2-like uncharacterized protein YtfP
MLARLFVYGTLTPGRPNAHVLSSVKGEWQKGWVRGQLLHEGWGAKFGYPGLVLDDSAKLIEGFLLSSEELTNEWARLDNFEGAQYERVIAQVHLASGRAVSAFVYQIKRQA